MPAAAFPASKERLRPKKVAEARLRRMKGAPVRPVDLQASVAETVRRLQNFHRSLEVAGSTYPPERLQMFSENLAAIRDQLIRLPKPPEALPFHGRRPATLAASPAPATPPGLGQWQALVAATSDLRAANGKLSANAVAEAFGVSINQLAGWLGRTRQAVSKTPDADSLQDGLAAFEQVARLRTVLAPDAFRKWLRMPNEHLDGAKPLDLLTTGQQRPIVAGLVEDMLTGMPT